MGLILRFEAPRTCWPSLGAAVEFFLPSIYQNAVLPCMWKMHHPLEVGNKVGIESGISSSNWDYITSNCCTTRVFIM